MRRRALVDLNKGEAGSPASALLAAIIIYLEHAEARGRRLRRGGKAGLEPAGWGCSPAEHRGVERLASAARQRPSTRYFEAEGFEEPKAALFQSMDPAGAADMGSEAFVLPDDFNTATAANRLLYPPSP